MSVLKTESRLPGGLANASSFGFAATNVDNSVALISYMEEHFSLQLSEKRKENKPIRNTYIVFVDDAFLSEHNVQAEEMTYEWVVELLDNDLNVIYEAAFRRFDAGSFHLNTDDLINLPPILIEQLVTPDDTFTDLSLDPDILRQAAKLRVNVYLYDGFGSSITLQHLKLSHPIGPTAGIVEYLKAQHGSSKNAFIGHEQTTRLIANDYQTYLLEAKSAGHFFETPPTFTELKNPRNIVAAVLYQYARKRAWSPDFGENFRWKGFLNSELEPDDPDYDPVSEDIDYYSGYPERLLMGVCGVKPHFLAMFLPKNDQGDTYTALQKMDTEGVTEKTIYNAFADLSLNERVDIYNYLRFPRTCIRLAAFLLDKLKEEHDDWKDLEEDQLAGEGECVRNIATEYHKGPHEDLDKKSRKGSKTFPVAWSTYIQLILLDQDIAFEQIKIKVLDVRSGDPIPRATVKKIIIRGTDTANTTLTLGDFEFAPNNTALDDPSISLRAQQALDALGFPIPNPSDTFGPNERTQLNAYWSSRMPDGSIIPVDINDDQPIPNYLLSYITDEYNDHRATDEQGVLNVRIPIAFLNLRQIHLEVGFWGFPIALEKTLSAASDSTILIRDSRLEAPTNFQIDWILDYDHDSLDFIPGAWQVLDWEMTINEGEHFGWRVENSQTGSASNLKICEKLELKNNTNEFVSFFPGRFSDFYDEDDYPNHFVLFGMQWCQPVYDEFEDGENNNQINEEISIQDPAIQNLQMHLVTQTLETATAYEGKGFGKLERDTLSSFITNFDDAFDHLVEHDRAIDQDTTIPGPPFPIADEVKWGLSLHAKIGDPVFAIGAGVNLNFTRQAILNGVRSGPEDKACDIHLLNIPNLSVNYTHLSVKMGGFIEMVLPGQIIALAGRSIANEDKHLLSDDPGHLRITLGSASGSDQFVRDLVDAHNREVIPHNDLPLVYPCRAQVTQGMILNGAPITRTDIQNRLNTEVGHQELNDLNEQTALYSCYFSNSRFYTKCWAAAELKCPHIVPLAHTDLQVQFQLRFLNERSADGDAESFAIDTNPEYYHPGELTGDIGALPVPYTSTDNPVFNTSQTFVVLGSEHDGLLVRIRYPLVNSDGETVQVITWVESDLIGSGNQLTDALENVVAGISNTQSGISKSRMGIYMFRKVHGLLRYDNYAANFGLDFPGQLIPGVDQDPWMVFNQICFFQTP